jgi:Domain of unknown function (DUF4105)
VYLYRIRTSPENVRRLFLVYLGRINELADHAEFYHLLSNSCTVNIVRYAKAAGRVGQFDIKHLLNGFIDRYLYRAGVPGSTTPHWLPITLQISPGAFANPCQQCDPDVFNRGEFCLSHRRPGNVPGRAST